MNGQNYLLKKDILPGEKNWLPFFKFSVRTESSLEGNDDQ